MALQPFEEAVLPDEAFDVEYTMSKFNCSRVQAENTVRMNKETRVVMNHLYQVNIRLVDTDWLHLSIKRRDKQPIHDWRHLQQIKNMLIGMEHEGVELYPAESRLVDEANQYHLWVSTDPKYRFPWGWKNRTVAGPEEATAVGAVQRAFD